MSDLPTSGSKPSNGPFTVFVSSPGGLERERTVVFEEIESVTREAAKDSNPPLRVVAWPTDIAAGTAGYGQGVINRQTAHLDIFVCLAGTRMGTPTPRANSGTEEEFDCAMEAILAGHQVELLLLFSDIPVRPQAIDPHQLMLVRAFREKAARLGVLYHTFSDLDQLRHLFQVSLKKAYQSLLSRSSSAPIPSGPDSLAKDTVSKTITLPDRILSGGPTTPAPQWADALLVPIAEYRRQHIRLSWMMATTSAYFRFGFKYFDSREALYSAGSIQTFGQNILFHIGKNLDCPNWFATFYRSGIRLAANLPLMHPDARTSALFELDISATDVLTFRMDQQVLKEMFFPIEGLPAVAILGWGDENCFRCELSRLTLHVNPRNENHG